MPDDHWEPDGYCPVCGGETEHHERCSHGALEADRERLLAHIHRIDHRRVVEQSSCGRCRALRRGLPDTPQGWAAAS